LQLHSQPEASARRTRTRAGWQTVLMMSATLLVVGCASNKSADAGRHRLGPGDLVRIIPQDAGAPPNDHPARFDAKQIETLLGAVRMRPDSSLLFSAASGGPDKGGVSIQVFGTQDLRPAAPAVAEALAQASPRQDVALVLSQLRGGELVDFLRTSRVTAARVFHRDGTLQLIFGAVDRDPDREAAIEGSGTPKVGTSSVGVDRTLHFEKEIGYRTRPTKLNWKPVLPAEARFYGDDRNDWIALDTAAVLAAAAPAPAAPPAAAATSQPDSDPSVQAAETVERRLTTLRALREQGLIDEELYREKVRQVLDRYMDEPLQ
jgi:hypothetical protein